MLVAVALAALGALGLPLRAAEPDAIDRGLETFRAMLKADPWANPALLDADRGAQLWREARGPAKASLERCDLGKGPGVVDGAFAGLPRYFRDAGRVMDLETRLLWCMETLQGFDATELTARPHPAANEPVKDLGAITTWVATRSAGKAFSAPLTHPRERATLALGEALFHRRSGPFDFSCASCHGAQGKRIRRQGLAHLVSPEEARRVVGEWPAYRVSTANVMTLQHRLYDCYWQMRLPELKLGSEASVALVSYLVKLAEGGEIAAPGLKR
jgi:sulfur-oxidizing protein SoxA